MVFHGNFWPTHYRNNLHTFAVYIQTFSDVITTQNTSFFLDITKSFDQVSNLLSSKVYKPISNSDKKVMNNFIFKSKHYWTQDSRHLLDVIVFCSYSISFMPVQFNFIAVLKKNLVTYYYFFFKS